jgi:hypothetical protein
LDPGSEIRDPGWVKIRIRDKPPGSATLENAKVLVVLWCIFVQGAIPAISYSSSDDDDEDFFDAEVRYHVSYFYN